MKECKYCLEKIKNDALKCKHCGEIFVKENNFIEILFKPISIFFNTIFKTLIVILVLLFLMYSCIQSL